MNRESYLKKFHELTFDNIKSGLGIITKIDVQLDNCYKMNGSTYYDSNKKLFDEEQIVALEHEISKKIKHILDSPVLDNKIDYMHAALRYIKVLIIEENGEYIVSRKISGNQFIHLIIYVKENVDATLYLNTKTDNKELSFTPVSTEFIDIIVNNRSSVHFIELRDYGNKYFLYSRKKAHIGEYANIYWTNIEGPAKLNITELHSSINGKDSESIMNTIVLAKNSEYNIFTRTDHNAMNTKSLMHAGTIMSDSKSIMRGLVYIDENARNSNGYQKTEMLLLDNNSRAISIPDLEIHNNDVRCTHGSSITRPDAEKIFYIQSRGLNQEESKKLIIKGFYDSLLSEVPNGLRDNISNEIEEILYEKK